MKMWYVDVARILFLAVVALQAGHYATGQQTLPQNPLSLAEWYTTFTSISPTTWFIVLGVLLFFLLLVVLIKKKKERYQKVVYVPVPEPVAKVVKKR